jgi:excinuclease ABC subunit B
MDTPGAFQLQTALVPKGDQPQAIERLVKGLEAGTRCQTLLGVTGSGKTFTMAHAIARWGRPTLVISHNKTLAAQLYAEMRDVFPGNAVHYFVSYYDYYQPEAYIPQRDIYIEKDSDINEEIDRLRLAATSALLSRPDVIIVASVSCIYGLGSPEDYAGMICRLRRGEPAPRQELLRRLSDMRYERNEVSFDRGKFRVRGDVIEICPAYLESALRVELDDDRVAALVEFDPLTGRARREHESFAVFPAKHYVLPDDKVRRAAEGIGAELADRLGTLRAAGKLLEAQRLEARTRYDLELLLEVGYCKGIENYSRHLSGRAPGQPPYTLLDYFPKDFLCIVDESHVTLPQIHGMYNGDQARKTTLVEHGFRLPSALDNRPLRFEEWRERAGRVVFVSATPGAWELEQSGGVAVEQVIRPTGLIDPAIQVAPARDQVPDLLERIRGRVARKERVLVTTLTKRLAEDLAGYIRDAGLKGRYLHSDIDTLERVDILRELREGVYDVLVGVNLLREGLDLPEVSLVAILDADKEGFLRSETSLIQTVGRTARNVGGEVVLYADRVTPSMRRAIDETNRRRAVQIAYNTKHGITPKTIQKEIRRGIEEILRAQKLARDVVHMSESDYDRAELVARLEAEMYAAAAAEDFERAAVIRDRIRQLTGQPGGKRGRGATPDAPAIRYTVGTAKPPARPAKPVTRGGRRGSSPP